MITDHQAWQPVRPEIPRDHWGRPLIIPINGGKPVAYTRCTRYVDCLEDKYKLGQWQERMVAIGLSGRPDLVLKTASLGPEPVDESAARSWKERVQQVCEAAKEAAKSSAAATIGTALHALTERVDQGLEIGPVPPQYVGHIANYVEATRLIKTVHVETFTVNDELKIGGTPDRVITFDESPVGYIADLKTGSLYGMLKIAMQLAVYAHCRIYNPETGERTPYAVDVSTDWGLVIALNAKTAETTLHWVDLVAGWQAVEVATAVRALRARRDLSRERTPLAFPRSLSPEPATDAALAVAIDTATSEADLIELWRSAGDRWTTVHTTAAAVRKRLLIKQAS